MRRPALPQNLRDERCHVAGQLLALLLHLENLPLRLIQLGVNFRHQRVQRSPALLLLALRLAVRLVLDRSLLVEQRQVFRPDAADILLVGLLHPLQLLGLGLQLLPQRRHFLGHFAHVAAADLAHGPLHVFDLSDVLHAESIDCFDLRSDGDFPPLLQQPLRRLLHLHEVFIRLLAILASLPDSPAVRFRLRLCHHLLVR
mmetsp:Transcript_15100/g.38364  ORF Transcript_15100/g.38364 Transcript_15100/m.38364 type:complete len:200 (+) Transcript_15100:186-785(+)